MQLQWAQQTSPDSSKIIQEHILTFENDEPTKDKEIWLHL